MLDFLMVSTRTAKSVVEIYPKFIINNRSKDLMIRGGDFYAVWDADTGFWSTDEQDLIRLVDKELDIYAESNKTKLLESAIPISVATSSIFFIKEARAVSSLLALGFIIYPNGRERAFAALLSL